LQVKLSYKPEQRLSPARSLRPVNDSINELFPEPVIPMTAIITSMLSDSEDRDIISKAIGKFLDERQECGSWKINGEYGLQKMEESRQTEL
jgi:hypothetical protein